MGMAVGIALWVILDLVLVPIASWLGRRAG
jgi:hypothetical protein